MHPLLRAGPTMCRHLHNNSILVLAVLSLSLTNQKGFLSTLFTIIMPSEMEVALPIPGLDGSIYLRLLEQARALLLTHLTQQLLPLKGHIFLQQSVCDGTQNLNETESKTCLWYQIFSLLRAIPIFSDADTNTFFDGTKDNLAPPMLGTIWPFSSVKEDNLAPQCEVKGAS